MIEKKSKSNMRIGVFESRYSSLSFSEAVDGYLKTIQNQLIKKIRQKKVGFVEGQKLGFS